MRERTPLLTAEGEGLLTRLREHADAPRWNYAVGDRLEAQDIAALDAFREQLKRGRGARQNAPPTARILLALAALRLRVPWYRDRLPSDMHDLERAWQAVPTASRRDLALAPWEFVPDDADLSRLVIYRTAGTTGHPIEVPHHPRAIACYQALIEHALGAHGVTLELDPNTVACFLVSAQVKTYTYSTVLYGWAGAGFAKLNLRVTEWPSAGSAQRYFSSFAPQLLTGEPVSFAELMEQGIRARPLALLSTSLALSPALAQRLRTWFACPVLDWYSLVETGPIAYSCPVGPGFHLLPHDLYVEILRPDGSACAPGERGEITVTGGRNPFLPLLRYRTGDSARLSFDACACGDAMPRLLELAGRAPMLFRASDGTPVGSVDLSRLLREFPLLRHRFEQRADRSCELVVCPRPGQPELELEPIERALRGLLGSLSLELRVDLDLADASQGEWAAYRSDLALEG